VTKLLAKYLFDKMCNWP